MTNFPTLCIGIITFRRPDIIRQTLRSLIDNLHYSGEATVIIADDCSGEPYLTDLRAWWRDQGAPWPLSTLSPLHNSGWGANVNHLLRHTFERSGFGYLYQQEDDYVLHKPLDLDVGVAVMQQEQSLGMMRYRATAGTPMQYFQHETDVTRFLPNHRESLSLVMGKVCWLECMASSPTLWLYSNGPHLKNYQFHGVYGLYPEQLKLGTTEESYAHVVQDRMLAQPKAPRIGILPEWIHMHYDHIGETYQLTALDKGIA